MLRGSSVSILGLFTTLAACGGGGDSATVGSSLPSPGTPISPTTPITPPSPMPAATNESLRALVVDQTFIGPIATLQYYVGGTSHSAVTFPADSQTGLSYIAADQSYRFQINNNPITQTCDKVRDFKSTDIKSSDARSYTYVNVFNSVATHCQYTLFRATTSATNDLVQLTYVAYGAYMAEDISRFGDTNVDFRPFAYGFVTAEASVPSSGTAVFNGIVAGQAAPVENSVNSKFPYDLTGTVNLTLNFAARSANGSIRLTGTRRGGANSGTPETIDFGTIQLLQQSASTLAGFTGTAGDGTFRAFLAGPTGSEIGFAATFQMPAAIRTAVYNEPITYRFAIAGAAAR